MNNHTITRLGYLTFIVGVCASYDINIMGRVPLSEIIAFSMIPFLYKGCFEVIDKERFNVIIVALGLWCFGIIISDVYASSEVDNFVRGIMKPIFVICWVFFIVGIIKRDYKSIIFIPAGEVFASIQNYIMPQSYSIEYMMAGGYAEIAFGIGPIVNAIGVLVSLMLYDKSPRFSVIALVVTGIVMTYIGGTRSGTGLLLLSAILILIKDQLSSYVSKLNGLSFIKVLIFLMMVFSIVYVIVSVYIVAADSGWMGDEQKIKLYDQSNNIFGATPLGLLMGGRAEVFGGILAILDRPIIGFGSWSAWQMSDYFFDALKIVGADDRLENIINGNEFPGIGHSVLIVAWLENSVLAFIAMLLFLFCILNVLFDTFECKDKIMVYAVILSIFVFWSFFASPFTNVFRYQLGLLLALFITKTFRQGANYKGSLRYHRGSLG